MKSNPLIFIILLLCVAVAWFLIYRVSKRDKLPCHSILTDTWQGYKQFFIDPQGRVNRNQDGDTVSEGQAYAMLRAVWMDDKQTFDLCYQWSEQHLSRKNKYADNLLAWQWKDGEVMDWMPASDADLDYALSLIFAENLWGPSSQGDSEPYGQKARKVLNDILNHLTYRTQTGRLYLSPWIFSKDAENTIYPVNPSYYSPAHFRVFYRLTGDERWKELIETTYFILEQLAEQFDGEKGVGLIPDWCSVSNTDSFGRLEGKSDIFGWEAIRVPIRVSMDYVWFGSKESLDFLNRIAIFFKQQWNDNHKIWCEYEYDGSAVKKYENPLFYAGYYCTFFIVDPALSSEMLQKTHSCLVKVNNAYIYDNISDYYTNSLAWIADGYACKLIRNITKENASQ